MTVRFEELRVLQSAEKVADDFWDIVITWGSFAKDSMGVQLIRAADSIGANIAEAYGRYHYGEKLQFLYYARGSLFETKYWLNRGKSRGIFNPSQFDQLSKALSSLAHQLNTFAEATKEQKKTGSNSSRKIAEERPHYHIPRDPIIDDNAAGEDIILFSLEDFSFLESSPTISIT